MARLIRRRFCAWLGRAAAIAIPGRFAHFDASATAAAADEPLWRFVQWNDTHADVTEPTAAPTTRSGIEGSNSS